MSDIQSGDVWSVIRGKINMAIKWASAPIGEVVESGLYSARHYANASGLSATAAAGSETAAGASATSAANSATAAANSATAAAGSVSVSLAKASNLSDLQSIPTARANLLASSALAGLSSAHGSQFLLGAGGSAPWNRAAGASDPLGQFWENGVTAGGITATRFASGIDATTGETWVEYDVAGTMTSTSAAFGYISIAGSQTAGLTGETWTASARLAVVSGNVASGLRVGLFDGTGRAGNTVTGAATISTVTRTLAADVSVRAFLQISGTAGAVVAGRVRVQGLQFEKAAVRTAGMYRELTGSEARTAIGMTAAGSALATAADAAAQRTLLSVGRRHIQTLTANNSAVVDFTSSVLTAPSGMYEIEFDGVVPVTSNANLVLLTSTNGGASFDSAAGSYTYASLAVNNSASTGANGGDNTFLPVTVQSISNTANVGGANGTIRAKGLGQARRATFTIDATTIRQDGLISREMNGGQRNAVTAVNGLRLIMTSGNILLGTFSIYEVVR